MYDIFYTGTAPGVFAHERSADSIEHARQLSRTGYFWWVSSHCDYGNFDFYFTPPPWQGEYTHVWPTQWKEFFGAYLVPTNNSELNYHYHTQVLPPKQHPEYHTQLFDCDFDTTWVPHPWDSPFIYVFGNQWYPAEKMPTVEYHVPGATERKFMPWPRAQLRPDKTLWTVPDGIDSGDVDFSWVPDPGSPPYIYQFATQHQKTGGPQYRVPGATDIKYVEQVKIRTSRVATAVYEIDHSDGNAGHVPNTTRRVRFFDNYRDTLIRLATSIGEEHDFVWICSSVCDYKHFDFSWHPEQWQATMLHVFPSNDQKFGDTFFMHVPTFRARAEQYELLDWYDLNFCTDQSVPRRPFPCVEYSGSSAVPIMQAHEFRAPYTLFQHTLHSSTQVHASPSLWSKKHRELITFSAGNSTALVPKDVKQHLETQVYDYPWIKKSSSRLSELPQDIVFISYDELNADQNYSNLVSRFPQAKRVHGVEGMVAALEAAARASTTDWFYAVFAKTQVHESFKFDFAPDRFQQPKHYIFYAINAVNDLVYGEMGIILYNKQMVLDGPAELGIDYTMSFPNETIPQISAYGNFNTDPYQTWRTAFRETAKLCLFQHQSPSVETEHRLSVWLSHAHGAHAEWAMLGAQDGKQFFEDVDADETQLKAMFSWKWLRERYCSLYEKTS
jgi:hypothetical protein